MSQAPRLSIVVPVHDAGYGGNLAHRLQISLTAFVTLARRYDFACEVLVVEWSAGVQPLRELIELPAKLAPATIRFIEVPAQLHDEPAGADTPPIQMGRARNIGLRRTQSEWILVVGADVLPNYPLGRFFARAELDPAAFYRIDRRDLARPLPPQASLRRQLLLARLQPTAVRTYYGLIHEPMPLDLRGRLQARHTHREILAEYNRTLADPQYVAPPIEGGNRLIVPADSGLHRHASGDFFLMHRDRFHELRGYAELPTWGHIDSILCWTASSAGLRQRILERPSRLYHQPHHREISSTWPETDWRAWHDRYLQALESHTVLLVNGEDWGLPGVDLPQRSFA